MVACFGQNKGFDLFVGVVPVRNWSETNHNGIVARHNETERDRDRVVADDNGPARRHWAFASGCDANAPDDGGVDGHDDRVMPEI